MVLFICKGLYMNIKNTKVTIMGSKWTIKFKKLEEDNDLQGCDGYCDYSINSIVIKKQEKKQYSVDDLENEMRKTLRHELIHAYLHESGLSSCIPAQSGHNELYIDWFANKYPQIENTFKELGIND